MLKFEAKIFMFKHVQQGIYKWPITEEKISTFPALDNL